MHTFAQKSRATEKTSSGKTVLSARSRFGQSREANSPLRLQRTISNQDVIRLVQNKTEDLDEGSLTRASSLFVHDFSHIPVHASGHNNIQPNLEVNAPGDMYEQEAERFAEQALRTPEPKLQRVYACDRTIAIDRDGPPEEVPQKEEPAPQEKPPAEDKTCQLAALAPTFKVTVGSIKAKELKGDSFGNTARLAAYFTPLKACKENNVWKFSLSQLDVNARVDVQPASFTNHKSTAMTDIKTANDAAIDGTNWKRIVSSLNPNAKVVANPSCSGINYPQTITNYPRRREFWSRKITLAHENFHLAEWTKIYRKELVAAENKLRAFTVSDTVASSEADALAKANPRASQGFPKAYQDATATYCKTKEVDAYNRDAPHYKQLVADIRARAVKEGWK